MPERDEIPDEVMEKARSIASDVDITIEVAPDGQCFLDYEAATRIIARAIMEERGRCAKIADEVASDFAAYRDHFPQRDGASAVAAAIRSGKSE